MSYPIGSSAVRSIDHFKDTSVQFPSEFQTPDPFYGRHPSTHAMLEVCRLCFSSMNDPREPNRSFLIACHELAKQRPRDKFGRPGPWKESEADLHIRITQLLGEALQRDAGNSLGWACFRALKHRAAWLAAAEQVAQLDEGDSMRQFGGIVLPPAGFGGEMLRAQLLPVVEWPPQTGEVLVLSWQNTGRRVARSLLGRWGALDLNFDPE